MNRWKKEIWKDKHGKPMGYVLVKREKGKVKGIIYSRSVKAKKRNDLLKGRRIRRV